MPNFHGKFALNTWILTRDGSPTLWNNELAESYRSVRGAFTESFSAFTEPSLAFWEARDPELELHVGEFGLGPGTNWMLFALMAYESKRKFRYLAVEREPAIFAEGLAQWKTQAPQIAAFLSARGRELTAHQVLEALETAPRPETVPSPEALTHYPKRFHVWFHDPFGFEVNPEGYSLDILKLCAASWAPTFWGGSYACNRRFQETLAALCVELEIRLRPTGGEGLKRERLEFVRR